MRIDGHSERGEGGQNCKTTAERGGRRKRKELPDVKKKLRKRKGRSTLL